MRMPMDETSLPDRVAIQMHALGRVCHAELGSPHSFALLVFRTDTPLLTVNYISDCAREDMVEALKALLANLTEEKP